ncbi:MAG TPA: DUF1697 domain-containing protein [Dissulfurispiraceae bacterium]|nr:DUF1697 domain-containing protein [Dissulfurispiraceae bacterium]
MKRTNVILLRGVTPTGKNRVPMADLRSALADAGFVDVQTYIQSGNAIVKTAMQQAEVETFVHNVIKRRIGADITVLARTPSQLGGILKNNPFPSADPSKLYFTILSDQPNQKLIDTLFEINFSPDKIEIIGDTIYTLYATKHSDSKFNNNSFERKIKVAATTRNFNTMTSLVKMSRKDILFD